MKKIILYFLFILILLYKPTIVLAQETREIIFSKIVNALNKETDEFYTQYVNFVTELSSTNDNEPLLNEFPNKISSWRAVIRDSSSIYYNYNSNSDSQIAEISQKAIWGTKKGAQGLDAYENALNSETDEDWKNYLTQGDNLINEAVTFHDEAVNLYNEYSGINESFNIRDILIISSVVALLFSLILFIKSRTKSQIESEMIRSGIYKELFRSSLWMTIGLLITTIGFASALNNGGTYYILYGPIIVGGWQLLKGLYIYFTQGRPVLNKISKDIKNNAIKESFIGKQPLCYGVSKEKTCPNCESIQSSNSIVCNKCGENIL